MRVIDGFDDSPEAGVVVGGATTGADGGATLSFADAGVYRLKAEKPDAIRSNAQVGLRGSAGRGSVHLGGQDGARACGT